MQGLPSHSDLPPASPTAQGAPEACEQAVQRQTRELALVRDATIMTLAAMAESRGADTGNHIVRVQHDVRALARRLSTHPRFASDLTSARIDLLFKAVPLHDIGKIGIPDRVLLKPGRLDANEFEIMKKHAEIGRDTIAQIESRIGVPVPFLELAREIAYSHHEKWDGTGYPLGLRGEAIPLSARLMAVADVYDALISRRVYKDPMPHEQALGVIRAASGRHFDPDVAQAFIDIEDTIHAIAVANGDSAADLARKHAYLHDALPGPLPAPST